MGIGFLNYRDQTFALIHTGQYNFKSFFLLKPKGPLDLKFTGNMKNYRYFLINHWHKCIQYRVVFRGVHSAVVVKYHLVLGCQFCILIEVPPFGHNSQDCSRIDSVDSLKFSVKPGGTFQDIGRSFLPKKDNRSFARQHSISLRNQLCYSKACLSPVSYFFIISIKFGKNALLWGDPCINRSWIRWVK